MIDLVASLESRINRFARSLVELYCVPHTKHVRTAALFDNEDDVMNGVTTKEEADDELDYERAQMVEKMIEGADLSELVYDVAVEYTNKLVDEKLTLATKNENGEGDEKSERTIAEIEKRERKIKRQERDVEDAKKKKEAVEKEIELLKKEISDKTNENNEYTENPSGINDWSSQIESVGKVKKLQDKLSRLGDQLESIEETISEGEFLLKSLIQRKETYETYYGSSNNDRLSEVDSSLKEFSKFTGVGVEWKSEEGQGYGKWVRVFDSSRKGPALKRISNYLKQNATSFFGYLSSNTSPSVTDPEDMAHGIAEGLLRAKSGQGSMEDFDRISNAIYRKMRAVVKSGESFTSVDSFLNWVGTYMRNAVKAAKRSLVKVPKPLAPNENASNDNDDDEANLNLIETGNFDEDGVSPDGYAHLSIENEKMNRFINTHDMQKFFDFVNNDILETGREVLADNPIGEWIFEQMMHKAFTRQDDTTGKSDPKSAFAFDYDWGNKILDVAKYDPEIRKALTYKTSANGHKAGDMMDNPTSVYAFLSKRVRPEYEAGMEETFDIVEDDIVRKYPEFSEIFTKGDLSKVLRRLINSIKLKRGTRTKDDKVKQTGLSRRKRKSDKFNLNHYSNERKSSAIRVARALRYVAELLADC